MTGDNDAGDEDTGDDDGDNLSSAFARERRKLAARLAKFMLSQDDLEDVLQETFLKAHGRQHSAPVRSLPAYLYTIAKHLIFHRLKQSRGRLTIEIEDIDGRELVSQAPTVDDEVHHRRAFQSLMQAVDTLPAQCRRVFLLRKIYGKSQKEIAQALGISTSTVERHITNAIGRCRRQLERGGYTYDNQKTAAVGKATDPEQATKAKRRP